ncbi:hypothetical protein [Actinoallomurus liliacearum]
MATSSRVEVTPDMVAGAAKNFAVGQRDIVDAWMRLQGALEANHGMAGDDKAAHAFDAKYAPAVQAVWKGFRQAIVVLGGTSLGLTQTANNHLSADHRSRADGRHAPIGLLGPNQVYPDMSMTVSASAIGPAATGPYLGANKVLAKLLAGYWPAAQPNNLESAAGAWRNAASEVIKVADWLDWCMGRLTDSTSARDFAAMQKYWTKVHRPGDGHSLLGGLAKLCDALGDACEGFAGVTWSVQNKVNLIVSAQEVLVILTAGTEEIIARLTAVLDRMAAAGVAAVSRVTGRTITAETVAGLEAATAGTPKIEPVEAQFEATAGKALADEMGATDSGTFANSDLAKAASNGQERGLAYEAYLQQKFTGGDPFSSGGRQFDGVYSSPENGVTWYEAKSGRALEDLTGNPDKFSRFKSNAGQQAAIARKEGVHFEIVSENPIPESVKSWLDKKGIPYRVVP